MPPTFERARALALELVGVRSVTGSSGEIAYPSFLADLIRTRPLLATAGVDVRVRPCRDGSGRANVFALLRRGNRRTVALTGHFDTVATSDFGELESYATDPERLAIEWQRSAPNADPQPDWLKDIADRSFLPGRGMLDMKSGLAAAIVAMEEAATDPDFTGNLLLVASPDEEGQSAGMRSAAFHDLPDLLEEWDLDPVLAINLDATADRTNGTIGQSVPFGTMGKLLLCAYVVGRGTHACYPARGVNAAMIAAHLAQAFEGAAELTDESEPDAPPPTILHLRDLKDTYDVTTPDRAYAYWNVITYLRSPADVLAAAKALADRALADVTTGDRIRVIDAEELARLAPAFRPSEQETGDGGNRDITSSTCERLAAMWRRAKLDGPAVVFGFASVPYPSVRLGTDGPEGRLRQTVVATARQVAEQNSCSLTFREHLAVISDLSFLATVNHEDFRVLAANTPCWHTHVMWSLAVGRKWPSINVGPWGRGYHGPRERVHQNYAFGVLPGLVYEIARAALADEARTA